MITRGKTRHLTDGLVLLAAWVEFLLLLGALAFFQLCRGGDPGEVDPGRRSDTAAMTSTARDLAETAAGLDRFHQVKRSPALLRGIMRRLHGRSTVVPWSRVASWSPDGVRLR